MAQRQAQGALLSELAIRPHVSLIAILTMPTNRQFKVSLRRQTSYFANDPKNRVDNSLRMIDLNHVASVNKHLRSTG